MHHANFKGYHAGVSSSFQFAIEFVRWAEAMGDKIDRNAIMRRFNVSKSTACKWLTGWHDAQARAGK